jgi:hypothetical protein
MTGLQLQLLGLLPRVEALPNKPEGRGFESRRGNLIFSVYLIPPAAL